MQPFCASLGLEGTSRMIEKGAARLRKTAQRGDDVIEKAVKEMGEGKPALRSQEIAERFQVARKVLREDGDRFPTGHSGRGASEG